MSDYTEVSSQGWFSRLKDAIVGVLAGIVLFLVAFPVLWFNEGRAVHTARSLEEGAGAVVDADAAKLDPAHEGKLVHVSGAVATKDVLVDDTFGVAFNGLRLKRTVEMYQWVQHEHSETQKKLGGGTETVKTYKYEKEWSEQHVNSGSFKVAEGHLNPAQMPVQGHELTASNVTLGAYRLPARLVAQVGREETLPVEASLLAKVTPALQAKAKIMGGQVFVGNDASNPAVGDLRVTFKAVKPSTVSIVSVQKGDTFEPYKAKAGSDVELLQQGTVPSAMMFKSAQEGNATLTWLLRVVGFLMMMIGVYLVARPIAVVGDVVPFIGSFLAFGAGIFGFLVATVLSTVTCALAWFAYRPLLTFMLLAVSAAGAAGLAGLRRRRTRRAA